MSYFPTDIPFMSEEELKANGIKVNCSEKPNGSKLRKCPFCGKEAKVAVVGEPSDRAGWWYVICTNVECPVKPQTLHCYEDKADAVEAWNRRAE